MLGVLSCLRSFSFVSFQTKFQVGAMYLCWKEKLGKERRRKEKVRGQ